MQGNYLHYLQLTLDETWYEAWRTCSNLVKFIGKQNKFSQLTVNNYIDNNPERNLPHNF